MSGNQSRIGRSGRLLLGFFVFGWLNAVAQPCVMPTMHPAGNDNVGAPEMAVMAAHGHHADDDGGVVSNNGCGHCSGGSGTTDCLQSAPATADHCDATGNVMPEGRLKEPGPHNLPSYVFIGYSPPVLPAEPIVLFRPVPQRQAPSCTGPAINLRFCVFLK